MGGGWRHGVKECLKKKLVRGRPKWTGHMERMQGEKIVSSK